MLYDTKTNAKNACFLIGDSRFIQSLLAKTFDTKNITNESRFKLIEPRCALISTRASGAVPVTLEISANGIYTSPEWKNRLACETFELFCPSGEIAISTSVGEEIQTFYSPSPHLHVELEIYGVGPANSEDFKNAGEFFQIAISPLETEKAATSYFYRRYKREENPLYLTLNADKCMTDSKPYSSLADALVELPLTVDKGTYSAHVTHWWEKARKVIKSNDPERLFYNETKGLVEIVLPALETFIRTEEFSVKSMEQYGSFESLNEQVVHELRIEIDLREVRDWLINKTSRF